MMQILESRQHLFFVLISMISFFALGCSNDKQEINVENIELENSDFVRIEVFNGCRDVGAIREIVSLIRRLKLADVVNIENSPGNVYPRTIVLDRQGESAKLNFFANNIGIGEDRVLLQRNVCSYDGTLVIGLDYREFLNRLRLQAHSE
jgi:hypothetical protein